MLDRHDLSDAEWAMLEPVLPGRTPRRGGRRADHRLVVSGGCFWRMRTGSPWRDLAGQHGHWKTVCSRHRRWSGDGTWVKVLDGPRRGCDEAGARARAVAADATVVRAHQPAAGARHAPPPGTGPARLAVAVLSAPGGAGG
jgi:transposase